VADPLNLIFRPVRPADKPRVLDFTAHTWGDEEEGDYIKDVFDDWLADARGQFVAVELDGRAVAIGRLTDLGAGELWLEGLRVDPAYRKQGIGEALHNYCVDRAQRTGGVLRYATGQDNVVSQMLGARTGFEHVSTCRWHTADASTEFAPPDRLNDADRPTLLAWLDSPHMRSARGLYQVLWKWGTLSEARLAAHIEAGQTFGLRGETGLGAWSICSTYEGWDTVQMNHLDGIDQQSMIDMARAMRRHAADAGKTKIEMMALDPSPLIDTLREAGYRCDDFRMWILELRLDKS
jgi:GNAT superfamily N-acetyltransferase